MTGSFVIPGVIGLPLAALAFVLPGLTLVRREEWRDADPVAIAAIACAGSIAWWAVGIWFIGYARLPLSLFALLSLAGAGVFVAWRRGADVGHAMRAWRATPSAAVFGFCFVVAVVATRAIFAFTRLGFSVGDMSAHAYMAELIVMRDGLPDTYAPFLPISDFGAFPPGFHALAAVETLLGGVPTYRSTIHVLAWALVALTFSLAALLRQLGIGRVGAALAAAGALMLGRHPQFFAMWGGAPTLLAAAVVFLVMRDALRLVEPLSHGALARLGFLSAGVVLVHQLPVASFLYVFPPVIALRARRDVAAWKRVALQGTAAAAIAVALAVPFIIRTPLRVPPDVASWAHDWFRGETARALRLQMPVLRRLGAEGIAGAIGPQTWPFYLVIAVGVLPLFLMLAGLAARWIRQRDHAAAFATTVLVMYFVMFAGAMTESVPLWPSLYPTRSGIWLAAVLAIALATLGAALARRLPRRALHAAGALWLCAFGAEGFRLSGLEFGTAFYDTAKRGGTSPAGLLANEAAGGAFWVTTFNRDNAVLTTDDLRAMEWVRERTPPGAVFATNYGDAGNLVTAIAHRRVVAPHFNLQFFYPRELRAWSRTPPDFILVSSKWNPDYPRPFTAAELDGDSRVELAFRSGESRVYRVRGATR